ncbi:MAG TPA: cupin domain-containing protein [Amycolatopsis sp.]|nr:cupin domain-containing protein [Amycolatopsis sp.]
MSDTVTSFSHIITNSQDVEYVPFVCPEAGGTGGTSEFGEIAIVRETSHNGNPLFVAFWKVQPATSPLYDFPLGDESGYVIGGSATIELLDTGQTLELKAGDLYSFTKGTLSRWTIHAPFKKFVVVNDAPPAAV